MALDKKCLCVHVHIFQPFAQSVSQLRFVFLIFLNIEYTKLILFLLLQMHVISK